MYVVAQKYPFSILSDDTVGYHDVSIAVTGKRIIWSVLLYAYVRQINTKSIC